MLEVCHPQHSCIGEGYFVLLLDIVNGVDTSINILSIFILGHKRLTRDRHWVEVSVFSSIILEVRNAPP